ncbi:MAG: SagB/ThcOx family dehydrogenase [Candidatus Omnitrophica bacterium]|nr:SagB/ThcOx family dehydrogenase [Candidatus Omnitrophota bacterium]
MRKTALFLIYFILIFQQMLFCQNVVKLPRPSYKGTLSLEEVIFKRKSYRQYENRALSLEELSQLLWSCAGSGVDGVTGATRVFPSAGGIYPVDIYIAAGEVKTLMPGLYKYDYKDHLITLVGKEDVRKDLIAACYNQSWMGQAPVSFIFVGDPTKVSRRYSVRGESLYLPLDIGTSCQNLHLQAESLGLGTVMVGAFSDGEVKRILGLNKQRPFCVMPVGRPK